MSPWYWWADVPVVRSASCSSRRPLRARRAGRQVSRHLHQRRSTGADRLGAGELRRLQSQFYAKVFELHPAPAGQLSSGRRCGATPSTTTTRRTPALADEYGIVMGTSHHEPMMRAQEEWRRYGQGSWNYATQRRALRDVLARRHRANTRLREHHHARHARRRRRADDRETGNVALLERIVADQRKIIAESPSRRRHQGAAGLGALQGGAGLLRARHARAGRRDAAVVRRQLGQYPAPADAGRAQASGRRGRVLPLRLRRRSAQLQVAQHQSDRRRSGSRCTWPGNTVPTGSGS